MAQDVEKIGSTCGENRRKCGEKSTHTLLTYILNVVYYTKKYLVEKFGEGFLWGGSQRRKTRDG